MFIYTFFILMKIISKSKSLHSFIFSILQEKINSIVFFFQSLQLLMLNNKNKN